MTEEGGHVIRIDGFDDLHLIGHGGLGDVYRAERRSTGGAVAIKVLRDVSESSVAWHRTRRELTALVSLSGHAHVVRLLELLDLPAGPALVMEYAPGGSVADLLTARDDVLTVPEVVLVGPQTLMPASLAGWPVKREADLDAILPDLDVVYLLRIQKYHY